MSNILRLKSDRQLEKFLKLVVEEGVKKANRALSEADTGATGLGPQIERELNYWHSKVTEQEEEEEDIFDEETPDEPVADEPIPDEEVEAEAGAEEVSPAISDDISYDSVVRALNQMRAGKSVRDSAVKPKLVDYFDELDINERGVLLTFLKSLANLLQGTGEAADPSDPEYGYSITRGEETVEEPAGGGEEVAAAEEETVEEEIPEEEEVVEPAEETPIKVGMAESQDFSKIRRKIRILMS